MEKVKNMIKEILQTIKEEITENIKELGYYQEDMEIVLEIPYHLDNILILLCFQLFLL